MNGRHRRARPLLGTFVEVACRGDASRCLPGIEAAFGAIERVHSLMSPHEKESDLSRMNERAHLEPVRIDAQTAYVLETALALHRESAGAFDVAAGSAGTSRDIRLLAGNRVRYARPMRVDLGGIAKGYAVDRAIAELAALGITHATVNAGGDLRVLGDDAEVIHLRDPGAPVRLHPALTLASGAMATSAGYFTRAIVDPATGAVSDAHDSASVMAPTAMLADALAKVVLLRGPLSRALLERHDAHALVLRAAHGALHARWLPGLARLSRVQIPPTRHRAARRENGPRPAAPPLALRGARFRLAHGRALGLRAFRARRGRSMASRRAIRSRRGRSSCTAPPRSASSSPWDRCSRSTSRAPGT